MGWTDLCRSPTATPTRLVSIVGVVAGALLTVSAPAEASGVVPPGPAQRAAVPGSVSTPAGAAADAMSRAVRRVERGKPLKAYMALDRVRNQLARAHAAAVDQIGRPPADPESDDLPGPPSILMVARLDHRIHTDAVEAFDRLRMPRAILALRVTLVRTHALRDVMLDAVIALPPDGAGADYSDGMADTVTWYKGEVRQVSKALSDFRLTKGSRLGLERALVRVKATPAKVNQAWGGGE